MAVNNNVLTGWGLNGDGELGSGNSELANIPVALTTCPETVAMENFESYLLTLYPNPVGDVLNSTMDNSDISTIVITDVSGKTIARPLGFPINTGGLSSGVYYISVSANKGIHHSKFIKI
jgi:hypothetical protein